ncbi:hypothetical protein L1987_78364 [Smallanthus sonchifolius]|uniref:Uncharacterized protein n=1 Tax=Smallanthus sonchifolius TaxID=185202 RepID=A0ACB8ZCM5_9ASTR|nr:hypothetical protein L1987_78364 [Smallanthus sonchifolius]
MGDNYESCNGGYQDNYKYYYSEVWCEICGEPHYTQDYYHYQGYPTDFHHSYQQPYKETTPSQEMQHSALDSDSWTPGNLFRHLEEIKDQLIKSSPSEQQVFRHLEVIKLQILKSFPTEQQDDSFKVQEPEVIVSTSLVGSGDSKEQEPSNFTSIDQSKDRALHSEDHFSWKKQRSSNEDYLTKTGVTVSFTTWVS